MADGLRIASLPLRFKKLSNVHAAWLVDSRRAAMKDNELSITIGGRDENVDARATLEVLAETIALLRDIEAKQLDGRAKFKWVISQASKNSPLNLTMSGAPGHDRGSMVQVVELFLSCLGLLESGKSPPDWFDSPMLDRAKRIVKRIGHDISSVVYAGKSATLKITQRLAASVDMFQLPDKYREYGELEGRLGQITAHGEAHEFCIYDPLTNRKIHCEFPLEEFSRVRDALTKRARVSGLVLFRRNDDAPLNVEVENWSIIPEDEELPSIEHIHELRINATRGRPSEEIIAELRRYNA